MNKKLVLLNPKYIEQRKLQEEQPAEIANEEAKDEISDIRIDKGDEV